MTKKQNTWKLTEWKLDEISIRSHIIAWHPERTGICLPVLRWHFITFSGLFFHSDWNNTLRSQTFLRTLLPIYHTLITGFTGWMQESESLSSVPVTKSVQQHEFVPSLRLVFGQSKAVPKNRKAWRRACWLDPTLEYWYKHTAWPCHLAWKSSCLCFSGFQPQASSLNIPRESLLSHFCLCVWGLHVLWRGKIPSSASPSQWAA